MKILSRTTISSLNVIVMFQLLLIFIIIIFSFLIGPSSCASELLASNSIFSCSDCHTASLRVPESGHPFKIKCPVENPFCDFSTGTCQKMADPKCGTNDHFVCTSDGKMLDGNCTIYHDCSNMKKYECQVPGESFDPIEDECTQGECGFFNCTQKAKAPHSLFPQFYASCNKNKTSIVYKCPNNYEFIGNNCKFVCRSEGLFSDFKDCTKFYKCTIKNILTLYHFNCPNMMGFDQKSFMCVPLPSDKLPFCTGKNHTEFPNTTENPSYNTTNAQVIKYDFTCMTNGIFPDVNCTKFHICKDLKPISYQCNSGLIFNLSGCVKTNQCATYNCKISGLKVEHSIYKQYFRYCSDTIIIDKCPDKYELNATSQSCESICHVPGNIQNVDDCTLYFACREVRINKTFRYFNKTIKKCPEGTVFDPFLEICFNSDSVYIPNCKYTHKLVSPCLGQLSPECRIVDDKGLRKNCLIQYLHVGSHSECKEEIKALMGKIMNKNRTF